MHVSVVVPCYKRVSQTLRTLDLLLDSNGVISEFDLDILTIDSSPTNELENALGSYQDRVRYLRPENPGIAANKNFGALSATSSVIIFCDSDIEVEKDTISQTLKVLALNKRAAMVGGQVFWKGGEKDLRNDRPRLEDRTKSVENTVYIEALYSRFIATYKEVFEGVGGYDEKFFNMRGEGSDLSIRYWRKGYPLIYDQSIKVHHVWDAPDSAAIRVSDPKIGIARDLLKLGHKYAMTDRRRYPNFEKTVSANFPEYKDGDVWEFLKTQVDQAHEDIEFPPEEKNPIYDFKFLEVFSNEQLFEECIFNAEKKLSISLHT